MWTEPGAEQAPQPLDGVDVHFVDAVSIGIAGVFTFTMIDRDVNVAPGWETGIDAVLVGIDRTSLQDHFGDPGLDGGLLDIAA